MVISFAILVVPKGPFVIDLVNTFLVTRGLPMPLDDNRQNLM